MKTRRDIVLVGVAGVGKTILGKQNHGIKKINRNLLK